jgi:hypothetical protein
MNARFLVVSAVLIGVVSSAAGQERQQALGAQVGAPWRQQLLEWRKEYFAVEGEDRQARRAEGREKMAAIDDPAVVPVAIALLRTEKDPQFRRALIQPLIRFGGKEAVACLVKWSVEDDNPLLREEASKGLVGKEGLDAYLDTYIAYLKSPKYVSNAAEALVWTRLCQPVSTVEKPNAKLVKALINAIHTVQRRTVRYQVAFDTGQRWTPQGGINGTVKRTWGVDDGMVQVRIPVPQPAVVEALKTYTGQDYQYDESAWNSWISAKVGK